MYTSSIIAEISNLTKLKYVPYIDNIATWIDENTDIPKLLSWLDQRVCSSTPYHEHLTYLIIIVNILNVINPSEKELRKLAKLLSTDTLANIKNSSYVLGKNKKGVIKDLIHKRLMPILNRPDVNFITPRGFMFRKAIKNKINYNYIDLDDPICNKPFIFLVFKGFYPTEALYFFQGNEFRYRISVEKHLMNTLRLESWAFDAGIIDSLCFPIVKEFIRKQFKFCAAKNYEDLRKAIEANNFYPPQEIIPSLVNPDTVARTKYTPSTTNKFL
jgi:hypothetical protein